MPSVEVKDVKIHYEVEGEGDAIFLLNDLLDGPNDWSKIIEILSKDFKVINIDYRASGKSGAGKKDFKIADLAADMIAVADHLKLEKFHVIGDSMGGCVAQAAARHHGERIDKLILANTYLQLPNVTKWAFEVIADLLKDDFSDHMLYKLLMPWMFSSRFLDFEEEIKSIVEKRKKHPHLQKYTQFQKLIGALAGFNSTSWAKNIKANALIIIAEEDISVLFKDSRTLTRKIENSQVELFPGGHNTKIEYPTRFCEVIKDFINS